MTGRSFARVFVRFLFAGLALVPTTAWAQAQVPEAPTRWVTDSAGFLSEGVRRELDLQLEGYERQTGRQTLVWIARTTGGVPIEDFAVRAFAAWKVGRKGLDDGLALFVFTEDRALRIEVGYGLEGQVPDAIASRIIRETIVPRIQAGDPDGAIRSGVAALIAAVEGRELADQSGIAVPAGPSRSSGPPRPLTFGQKVVFGFLLLAFLILFISNPALAVHLLLSVLSSGRGGGGYSGGGGRGGGGFSGGGGRSGGGGASGSW